MNDKRRRWIMVLVLGLAVVGLLGTSLIPIMSVISQPQSSPTAASSPQAQKEDLQDQIKGYESVLQREPDNQTALRGLLYARLELIRQGGADVKTVIDPLERLVRLNPAETQYAVLLAQAKQYTGDLESAAQIYRDILTKRPGDQYALKGLVDLQLQQNRPEAAIGLLQDTLKTASQANQAQPGTVDVISVQVELGRVYATQKRYEESIAIFDEAIKADKQDFRPVLGKALVLKEQGKPDEAKALFNTAASLAPAQYKDGINRMASGELNLNTPSAISPTGSPAPGASPDPNATPTPTPSP